MAVTDYLTKAISVRKSYAYNPVIWESEARGFPWLWHHPGLCSEFQACLGSIRRPCLKLKKKAVKEISCRMSAVGSGLFTVWSFMLFTFWPHCHIAGTFHVLSASWPLRLLMSVPCRSWLSFLLPFGSASAFPLPSPHSSSLLAPGFPVSLRFPSHSPGHNDFSCWWSSLTSRLFQFSWDIR